MKNFEAPFLKKNLDNPKVGQKGYQTTKDLAYQRFSLRGFFYCCESKIINYEKSRPFFERNLRSSKKKFSKENPDDLYRPTVSQNSSNLPKIRGAVVLVNVN